MQGLASLGMFKYLPVIPIKVPDIFDHNELFQAFMYKYLTRLYEM